jgi:hypothetical protein
MNRRNTWRFLLWTAALTLACTMVPSAMAQCGLPTKPVKPAVWHPRYGGAHQTLVRAAVDDDDEQEPSIVGMWHVIFTAQTMNGEPFSGVIDNSIVVWHSDGTEIMNSSRPAQDGNFCLGVWTRAGKLKYHVNHIPWQGNDPSNAPGGIGNPQGGETWRAYALCRSPMTFRWYKPASELLCRSRAVQGQTEGKGIERLLHGTLSP